MRDLVVVAENTAEKKTFLYLPQIYCACFGASYFKEEQVQMSTLGSLSTELSSDE